MIHVLITNLPSMVQSEKDLKIFDIKFNSRGGGDLFHIHLYVCT